MNLKEYSFFLRDRMARFLRQLRCAAQSRALARSFASRLASSKSHPFCGKKTGFYFELFASKIAGFQRGSAPLAGFQRAAPFGGVWGGAPKKAKKKAQTS
jgi:hypothetical protein